MIFIIAASSAITIGLLVMLISSLVPARSRGVKARMAELELDGLFTADAVARRSRQQSRLRDLLEYVGEQLEERGNDWGPVRRRLIAAGYRNPAALVTYLGVRVGTIGSLAFLGALLGGATEATGGMITFMALFGAFIGWFMPGFILSVRIASRQKELVRALPDVVDLLVVCVEAGLGLNQALVRVAQEMRHQSLAMTQEISLTNMAIRAGTPRDQALLDWAERTQVADIRSLATMIIQTERFGTSIANSLRVHSDSMRTIRKQRAEEAAAKTTIKIIFPLALCIFPALFIVILGPALISIIETFSGLS